MADSCDPLIDECVLVSTETIYDYGSRSASVWIGVIALVKALTPLILNLTATPSSPNYATYGWWVGNLLVYGVLSLLWPWTYL